MTFSWRFKQCEGVRKPQIFAGNRTKLQTGIRHLKCCQLGESRVCRPAREPKTRKPPKVLPGVLPRVLLGVLPEIGVLPRVLSRVLSRVLFCCSPRKDPWRALSGALVGAPRFLGALPRALSEHFWRFPCFGLSSRSTDSQGKSLPWTTGPIPVSGETFDKLSGPLLHTDLNHFP